MSRSRSLITFILMVPILLTPLPASAHTLKVDGQIGVTLHVDPDDEPVASEMSTFFISIQDKSGAFNPTGCRCTIDVLYNGGVIDSLPFTPDAKGAASTMYSFPQSGRYSLTIVGTSQRLDELSSFTTTFTYQVKPGKSDLAAIERSPAEQSPLRTYTPLVVIAAALFLLILFLWPMPRPKRKQKVKKL